jgi:hypothetical protein
MMLSVLRRTVTRVSRTQLVPTVARGFSTGENYGTVQSLYHGWKRLPKGQKALLGSAVTAAGAVGLYIGNWIEARNLESYKMNLADQHKEEEKKAQTRAIQEAFVSGSVPPLIKPDYWIEREAVKKTLVEMIEGFEGSYLLVYGEHGCGKTSLVQEVCHKDNKPLPGMLYVDCQKYEANFKLALNYQPIAGEKEPSGLEIMDAFEKGALEYKNKAGKMATLVLDNVNILDPNLLIQLQRLAKTAADRREYMVVFVTSEGAAVPLLLAQSAKSRMVQYVVPDLSEAEAKSMLSKRYKPADVDFIYGNLTGGRLAHITRFLGKATPEIAIDVLVSDVRGDLVKIPPKVAEKFGLELLKNKQVSSETTEECLKEAPNLFQANLFSKFQTVEPPIRFHSKAIESHFKCLADGLKFAPSISKHVVCQPVSNQ